MKSQSSMEFMLNYGWLIIVILVIGLSLYYSGFFNSDYFNGLQVIGLNSFQVNDALLDDSGNFSIVLASKSQEYFILNSISYDVSGFNCSADFIVNSRIDNFLTILKIIPLNECDLNADYAEMNITLFYTSKYGLEKSEKGVIKLSVSKNSLNQIIIPEIELLLSNVLTSQVLNDSAIISWNSNKLANSSINYGTTIALSTGSNSSSNLAINHSLKLNNLLPETLYYYNVTSCNTSCVVLGKYNFTTNYTSGNFLFTSSTEYEFNEGSYDNTIFGSVKLKEPNTEGVYTSKIFDAKRNASWKSISWSEELSYGEENTFQEGIIGLWHLNEKEWLGEENEVIDSSKNDFHLTKYGNAQISKDAIFVRSGIFDSYESYLSKKYEEKLHPNKWTLSTWINPENFDYSQAIISYGIYYYLGIDHARIKIGRYCGGSFDWQYVLGNLELKQKEWVHVAGTWDGEFLRIYINGVLDIEEKIKTEEVIPQEESFFIGSKKSEEFYTGLVDEIVIYDYAREEKELLNDYLKGALRLNVSVRSCNDAECFGETWSQNYENPQTILNLDKNQYFQYRFNFYTQNQNYSPILHDVTVNYEIK